MRGAAGTDRGHGVLPPHTPTRGAAWAAGVGRLADAAVGRRDDRSRVGHAARRAAGRAALSWALSVAGSVASLAANVAVAEPTLTGRVIAAWPSFALTASWELLTRQVHGSAPPDNGQGSATGLTARDAVPRPRSGNGSAPPRKLQRQAWRWTLANRASDGTPSDRKSDRAPVWPRRTLGQACQERRTGRGVCRHHRGRSDRRQECVVDCCI